MNGPPAVLWASPMAALLRLPLGMLMALSRTKMPFQPSPRPVPPLMPQRVWEMPPLNMPVAELTPSLVAVGLTATGW